MQLHPHYIPPSEGELSVPICATLSFLLYFRLNSPHRRLEYAIRSDSQAAIPVLHATAVSDHIGRLCCSNRAEARYPT
jgi:hypothetical protein